MPSNSEQSSRRAEIRLLFLILFLYFFICFPLAQSYLKDKASLYNNWDVLFYLVTLTVLIFTRKLNFSKIGLTRINKKNIAIGLALGALPIISVAVLDALIVTLGLSENDLFSGAHLREPINLSLKILLIDGVLEPVISMIFITGYALNILAKKNEIAIPGNGILYSFMNFNLGMGYLGLGMIAAGLTRFTGSLVPAILFSIGCTFAKFLILTNYPRITTILVFLT